MDYNEAKLKVTSPDAAERHAIAADPNAAPEFLFFLAGDADRNVRLAVALNPATPAKAAQILSQDLDSEIRTSVAMKIARLFSHLTDTQRGQLYESTVKILEMLVVDQMVTVRAALASSLAEFAGTPPHIARQLAHDVEQEVAEPILRFCTILTDHDLLDIIGQHPWPWVLVSIAGRDQVSQNISAAIIETKDETAAQTLLNNDGAAFSKLTLEKVREMSKNIASLQKSFQARQTRLPQGYTDRIAGFVGRAIKNVLLNKSDLDSETLLDVDDAVKRRIKHKADVLSPDEAATRAQDLFKSGNLNETVIGDALAMRDDEFTYAAFVCLSRIPLGVVKKIMESQSPKAISALCWKCHLSARFALSLQKSHLGRVQPKQLIYPQGGENYALGDDEMKWNLEFFGA